MIIVGQDGLFHSDLDGLKMINNTLYGQMDDNKFVNIFLGKYDSFIRVIEVMEDAWLNNSCLSSIYVMPLK